MYEAILILLGAWLYRWRGMAHEHKKYFPRPFNQIVFAAPFAFVCMLFWYPVIGWVAVLPTLLVWTMTTLGVLTGHGRGMDLGETDQGDAETLEFLVRWAKPHLSLYWYDMLLLSVTGLAVTLPAGIATMNFWFACAGLLKGPAYAAAKHLKMGTEGGELLTGAVLWGAVAAVLGRK